MVSCWSSTNCGEEKTNLIAADTFDKFLKAAFDQYFLSIYAAYENAAILYFK